MKVPEKVAWLHHPFSSQPPKVGKLGEVGDQAGCGLSLSLSQFSPGKENSHVPM